MRFRPTLLAGVFLLATASVSDGQSEAWDHLRAKHDKNGDQKITAAEYDRGETTFLRLDSNEDGVITADDFRRTRGRREGRGGGARRGGRNSTPGRVISRVADADRDRNVSAVEWKRFLRDLPTGEKGAIDVEALIGGVGRGGGADMAKRMSEMLEINGDGVLTVADFEAHFAALDKNGDGELKGDEVGPRRDRQRRPRARGDRRAAGADEGAPSLGQMAPDFDLPYAEDSTKTIKLSSFAGQKPVALIFGSYT